MYCENPCVILNRKIHRYIKKDTILRECGNDRVLRIGDRLPSPKEVGATPENYDRWCLVDKITGETRPIFCLVPCGKCLLCRNKRAMEWTTRANCEASTADYPALFVTLTYEDNFLPIDGVQKKHVQNFLKRFRVNWKRAFGYALDLRYFAVGEYGSKFHRPHYHLLMWNVPNHGDNDHYVAKTELLTALHLIERSWSVVIDKETFESLPDYMRFHENRVKYGKLVTVYYQRIGRVDLSPDRGQSSGYCMKYMRKEQVVPDGMNPFFHLSSRGNGGLGTRYLNLHINEFRENPDILKIKIPYSGKIIDAGLPRCFKEKLFPSVSRMLPSNVRFQLERFHELSKWLTSSPHCYFFPLVKDMVSEAVESVKEKYGKLYRDIIDSKYCYKKDDLVTLPPMSQRYTPEFEDEYNNIFRGFQVLFSLLHSFQPNVDELETLYDLNMTRSRKLEKLSFPDVDVSSERYRLLKNLSDRSEKEIF